MNGYDRLLQQMEEEDQAAPQVAPQPPAAKKSGLARRLIADPAVSLAKGVVSAGEAVVGLTDIATGGIAGKGWEQLGYDPKETHQVLEGLYSPEQQEANRKVQAAEGFIPTVTEAVKNPSTIVHSAIESLPGMALGGGFARGAIAKAPNVMSRIAGAVGAKTPAVVGGALGEGLISAGSAAESIRQETGTLTPFQSLVAAGSGAATGVLGIFGGRIAEKLGLDDVDTLAAGGFNDIATNPKKLGLVKSIVGGAISEGMFEELPQSMQEQIAQNWATGKPWDEGLGNAAAMGMLTGAAMGMAGAGGGVIAGRGQEDSPPPGTPPVAPPDPYLGEVIPGAQPMYGNDALRNQLQDSLPGGLEPEGADVSPVTPPSLPPAPSGPLSKALSIAGVPVGDNSIGGMVAERRALAPITGGIAGDLSQSQVQQEGVQGQEKMPDVWNPPEEPPAAGIAGPVIPPPTTPPEPAAEEVDGVQVIESTGEAGNSAGRQEDAGKPASKWATPQDESAASFTEGKRKPANLFKVTDPAAKMDGYVFAEDHKGKLDIIKADGTIQKASPYVANRIAAAKKEGKVAPYTVAASKVEAIDAAAHEAATSPNNDLAEPSPAQIDAGNYKKGHLTVHGLDISIENPAGSTRKGTDETGRQWETKLANHYGYIKGTIGKDKDHLDAFIGPDPESQKVFVVNQLSTKTGSFDEHKVMLGYNSAEEARKGYLANYDKTGPSRIKGGVEEATVDEFKSWLKGDTTKEFRGNRPAVPTDPAALKQSISSLKGGSETVKYLRDNPEARQALVAAGAISEGDNLLKQAGSAIRWAKGGVQVDAQQGKAAQEKAEVTRTLDTDGRATDGKPIMPGNRFQTSSGRQTTPYPGQKGEKYASQWLIDNATAEAKSRGDDFNARSFANEKPMKRGDLPQASRDSMLMYLFGEQPAVPPPIIKPLTPTTQDGSAATPSPATRHKTAEKALDIARGKQFAKRFGDALSLLKAKKDGRDDYLVNDWVGDGKITRPQYRGAPYPMGDERLRLNKLFGEMVKAVQWTADGPVLKEGHSWKQQGPKQELMAVFNTTRKELLSKLDEIAKNLQARRQEEREERERQRIAEQFGVTPEPEPPSETSAPEDPNAVPSLDELEEMFDAIADEMQASSQEDPKAEPPGATVEKQGWTREDAEVLLEEIKAGRIVLVADKSIGIPVIHDFPPNAVQHMGYGTFRASTPEYEAIWDAGGAMEHTPSGKAYTTVQVKRGELPFWDRDAVVMRLRELRGPKEEADGKERAKNLLSGRSGRLETNAEKDARLNPLSQEQDKTVSALAAEFAGHGVKGIDEALKGLVEIFGGGKNKLQSFPAGFDEEAYKRAKPHFEAAAKEFHKAGLSFRDFVNTFFRAIIKAFGAGVKPYATYFIKEYGEQYGHQTPQQTETEPTPGIPAGNKLGAWVSEFLANTDGKLSWQDLFAKADEFYGGTQAEGRYTVKDAYDALELGINTYLLEQTERMDPTKNIVNARQAMLDATALLERIPTQTKRTQEQDEFQQFSTPPHFAYLANWVAKLQPSDVYLEPSAGIGGLALFGKLAGVKEIVVNELSERRRALLQDMPFDQFFGENAEQLDNILPDNVQPTVIVMNPPFSATGGRVTGQRDTMNGARHIEQALARLQPGGRLVAIVGEGMAHDKPAFRDWWNKIEKKYRVRANIGVDGSSYAKYGTTFDNQILVIDKSGQTELNGVVTGKVAHPAEALLLLQGVRDDRPAATTGTAQDVAGQPGSGTTVRPGAGGETAVDAAGGDRSSGLGSGGRGTGVRTGTGTGDTDTGGTAGDAESNGGRADSSQSGKSGRRPRGAADTADAANGGDGNAEPGPQRKSEISVESSEGSEQGTIGNSVFEQYVPKKVKIPGSVPHVTPLVESAALASVVPPDPTYTPNLPQEMITKGHLSDAQLEAVVYAGQAHQQWLVNGERRGFFLGDGTGVGKGRQISGIIIDNMRQGQKKAVWISKKPALIADAKRDFAGSGGDPKQIFAQIKVKTDDAIPNGNGVLFAGYGTLRSQSKLAREAIKGAKGSKPKSASGISYTRTQQIYDWLGKDFDGVIVFDEAHEMGNAVPMKGKRGTSKPSEQALAAMELQKALPKAKIVYVSATGATEVSNLAYASRLGLWGEGTPFSTVFDFVAQMSRSVSAMELVAQNLKQMGLYMARSLSFDGITYSKVEHQLTGFQREVYDTLAGSWQIVLQNINEALEITGVTEDNKGVSRDSNKIKSAIMSQFWGAHQRFFNQIITAGAMPTVLEEIEKDLKGGKAVVLQVVNTNEAAQERALAKLAGQDVKEGEEDAVEEMDLTPREQLIQYLERAFPVNMMEQYTDGTDDSGKPIIRLRPVVDSNGKPVVNKEALAKRDALIAEVKAVKIPDSAMQMLINHFGPDKVAEITGRKQRVVYDDKGKLKVEPRGEGAVAADSDNFKDGKKDILIFSQAGGTGFSFHADRGYKNQKQRVHYILQPGWSADKAIQGLGRTHRTNQSSTPTYRLVTTDIPAQKRFISSIARRLEQLGALTSGQRDTAGGTLFSASDNLESIYATRAVRQFFTSLMSAASKPGYSELPGDVMKQMGLEGIIDKETGQVSEDKMPPVTQFLNRLLSLRFETQEQVFDLFMQELEAQVQYAKQIGSYDDGLQTIKHVGAEVKDESEVHRDKLTNSATRYIAIDYKTPNQFYDFDEINKTIEAKRRGPFPAAWFKNKQSGKVAGIYLTPTTRTSADGRVMKVYGMWRTSGLTYDTEDKFRPDRWERIEDHADARALWEEDNAVRPETSTHALHMVVGGILPIWDRFNNERIKVVRVGTDDGRRFLGRQIEHKDLAETMRKLDVTSAAAKMTGKDLAKRVMEGFQIEMSNGWRFKRVTVSNDTRIEVIPKGFVTMSAEQSLRGAGVIFEKIQYAQRYFVPTGATAGEAMDKLMKSFGMNAIDVGGQDDVMASPGKPTGNTASKVKFAIMPRLSRWENAPKVSVVQSSTDLPPAVQDALRRRGVTAAGVYHNGAVHLVADAIVDRMDAIRVLLHEVKGHYGLRGMLGSSLNDYLDVVLSRLTENEIMRLGQKHRLNWRNTLDRYKIAEEYLSDLAQQGEYGPLRKIINAIKSFINRVFGTDLHVPDKFALDLLAQTSRFVEGGGTPSGGMMETAFSTISGLPKAFFSQLEKVVDKKMGGRMSRADLVKMLKGNSVTDAELETVLGDLLGDVVTKQEVMQAIRENGAELEDVILGSAEDKPFTEADKRWVDKQVEAWESPDANLDELQKEYDSYLDANPHIPRISLDELQVAIHRGKEISGSTQFSRWTEPGAVEGSYREMFVVAPGVDQPFKEFAENQSKQPYGQLKKDDLIVLQGMYRRAGKTIKGKTWWDGHPQYNDIKNPVVRIRFNERQAEGKRILFIEEMQGARDDQQQRMPEYLRKRLYDIGVKRILAHAKANGFDGVAWTTGAMQAERYDLSREISEIRVKKQHGFYGLEADDKSGSFLDLGNEADALPEERLPEFVGKELAERIVDDLRNRENYSKTYSGLDLKVGGEGLTRLYDVTLPALFKKYGKGGVGEIKITDDSVMPFAPADADPEAIEKLRKRVDGFSVPYIPITDQTPGSFPMFSAAWHGTPHDFDKFSTSKIGTGEGAQAYGYGLYFAGSREVAEWYRDRLTSQDVESMKITVMGMRWAKWLAGINSDEVDSAANAVGLVDDALKEVKEDWYNGKPFVDPVALAIKRAEAAYKNTPSSLNGGVLRALKNNDFEISGVKKGRLYQVELAPAEDEYLLWDKPLSEQSEKVKKLLSDDMGPGIIGKEQGQTLYRHLSGNMSLGSDKAASEYLHSLGIRGIKYLDGTSRSGKNENYNYVIFNEEDVEITAMFSLATPERVSAWKENVSAMTDAALNSSIVPSKLKLQLGKVFSNPWFGSENKPVRRQMVMHNVDRSHMRNSIIHEVFTGNGNYLGIEGMDNALKGLPADERAKFDLLMKEGDLNGQGHEWTDKELASRNNPTKAPVSAAVQTAYKAARQVIAKANEIRFKLLGEFALLPYESESWSEELKGILALRKSLKAALTAPDRRTFGQLLLKRGLSAERLQSDANPAGRPVSKEVINAYQKFWNAVDSSSAPKEIIAAYKRVTTYRSELEKIKKQWGQLEGYAPRLRQDGEYFVSVYQVDQNGNRMQDGEGNNLPELYMRPTINKMSAKLHAQKVEKDLPGHLKSNFTHGARYKVEVRRNNTTPQELMAYKGSEIAIEALVNSVFDKLDGKPGQVNRLKQEALSHLAHQIMAQGFARHGISRSETLIEGYRDTDYSSVLKEFTSGMAGWLSKMRYAIATTRDAKGIEQADPADRVWVHEYVRDSMKNTNYLDEVAATARAVGAVYYLGIKASSAILNGFQNYVMGQAELARMMKSANIAGKGDAIALLARAQKDVIKDYINRKNGKPGTLTAEETAMLERAIREGTAQAQAIRFMSGSGEMGYGKGFKKTTDFLMTPFSWVEQHVNREPAMLAAYRTFKTTAEGTFDEKAFKLADEFTYNTHFLMGRENLPAIARNPVGKTLYLFQSYAHNYLLWLFNRTKAGEFEAIARSLGAVAALGGVFAIPGADDLDKWIEEWFGVSYKLKFQKWMKKHSKDPVSRSITDFVNHGAPSVFGVDMSRALAINLPFVSDPDRTFGERMGGVWPGLLKKPVMAAQALQRGDELRAIENLMPEFIANPMRAARQMSGATTLSGKKIFDEKGKQMVYSPADAAKKALGFQPLEISERTQLKGHEIQLKEYWNERRSDVLAQVRTAKTVAETREATRAVMAYNTELRKSQAMGLVGIITARSIKNAKNWKPNSKTMSWESDALAE